MNLKVKNYKILLNFTNQKEDKCLVIHSLTNEFMDQFIGILKEILEFNNISELENLKYNYTKKKEHDFIGEYDWYSMPEYNGNSDFVLKSPYIYIQYDFFQEDFFKKLTEKININITSKTKYLWFPYRQKEEEKDSKFMYESDNTPNKYPIYIISKGRWEKRFTSKYLELCNIDYKIVVEPQEYEQYVKYIDKSKILILPDKYLNKNSGSIPARNFVLEHSQKNKDKRHWILDDNIMKYYRLNNNKRIELRGTAIFRVIEDYVDRYENIKMAGHNYKMFGAPNSRVGPITKNTRIYSSILLSNDTPFKWRGKYNEDTDLSLRILKKGYPTALFNCILADKQQTLKQKGGNTDTIYNVENALYLKAHSLHKQHPDVAIIKKRFNRIHHYVDYTVFKDNKPVLKENLKEKLENKIDNFSMELKKKI